MTTNVDELITHLDNTFELFYETIRLVDEIINGTVNAVGPITETKEKTIPFREYKKIMKKCVYKKTDTTFHTECAICLNRFQSGRIIHKTPCGHFFHPMCLRKVVCSHGPVKCPLCRNEFV